MALASESLLLFWGPCSGRQIRVRCGSLRLRNRLLPRLPRPSDRHLFPTRQSCEAKPLDFEIARLAHMLFHRNLIQIPHTCFWMKGSRNRNPGNARSRSLIEAVRGLSRERGVGDFYWRIQHGNLAVRRLYGQIARDTDFAAHRPDVGKAASAQN